MITLRWRHKEHYGVPNHQPHDCLLSRLIRRRSKKTSKLRVTGLCAGIHRRPVNCPHKWPVTRKMFPFDDVIMSRKMHARIQRDTFVICFSTLDVHRGYKATFCCDVPVRPIRVQPQFNRLKSVSYHFPVPVRVFVFRLTHVTDFLRDQHKGIDYLISLNSRPFFTLLPVRYNTSVAHDEFHTLTGLLFANVSVLFILFHISATKSICGINEKVNFLTYNSYCWFHTTWGLVQYKDVILPV